MAQSARVVGMAMREKQVVNRAQVDAQRLRILNEHLRRSGVEKQSAPTGFDIHRQPVLGNKAAVSRPVV